MVGRVILGDKPGFGMGGFVSLPGIEVMTCDKFQLMFSTQWKNLQFVASGSVIVQPATGSSIIYTDLPPIPNQGFFPLILTSCTEWGINCQVISNTYAKVGRGPQGNSGNTASNPHTCYYIVTTVPLT